MYIYNKRGMGKVKIYSLICPRTNEIKYIGKTIQSLSKRLKNHMHPTQKDGSYRANWIRELKEDSLKPSIQLIEECEETIWEEREMYWIGFYSNLFTLVNYTKGGNGGHHVKISTKEKLSLTYKEKWKNNEYRKGMSTMSKEMWEDEHHVKKMSDIKKEHWQDGEYREKMVEVAKEMWKSEDYRKNRLTDDSIEKMSQAKLGISLSDNHKDNIGKASKKMWEENRDKLIETRFKKVVIIEGVEFDSVKCAAEYYKVHPSTISRKVHSSKYPNYILKVI